MLRCPGCSTEAPDGDLFCENCGQRLAAATDADAEGGAGCSCGAAVGEIDEEGFCLQCGRRVVRPASDHIEVVVDADFAAVSDRGVRHQRNEDRFALGERDGVRVLVVCDGVSASQRSEEASAAVAERVCEALLRKATDGMDPEEAMRDAVAEAAASLKNDGGEENPPSTTLVAALVRDGEATVGWVGDSRAYWIGERGAEAWTRDHSWLNDAVSSGAMTWDQAVKAPQAHAIVKWLGADAGDVAEPEIVRRPLSSDGALLLCTDGLWNYAPASDVLLEVYREAAGADALETARRLVEFAIGKGGVDNITVALLRRKDKV